AVVAAKRAVLCGGRRGESQATAPPLVRALDAFARGRRYLGGSYAPYPAAALLVGRKSPPSGFASAGSSAIPPCRQSPADGFCMWKARLSRTEKPRGRAS